MVNVCPVESDPRQNVSGFISDPENRSLAGLSTEGLDALMEVVIEGLKKQEPESEIIRLDTDVLSDEDITFQRDLESYLSKHIIYGKKSNIVIVGELPVIGWNEAIKRFGGPDCQVYFGSIACRRVPLCVKMF